MDRRQHRASGGRPRLNSPAGHSPAVLAGRGALLQDWGLVLNDVAVAGRVRAQDIVFAGPRGDRKTATVTTHGDRAAARGFEVVKPTGSDRARGSGRVAPTTCGSRIQQGVGPWQRAKHAFDPHASLASTSASLDSALGSAPAADRNVMPCSTLAASLRRWWILRPRYAATRFGGLITVDELQAASPTNLALLAANLHRLNVDHPNSRSSSPAPRSGLVET